MTKRPDRRRGAARRLLVMGAAALAVAACAPRSQPIGPAVAAPALTPHAIVAADGYRLPLRVSRPADAPRAVVLALHGFGDYAHAFYRPARFWAEHGIITYAYDQRGFGATANPGIWAGGPTLRHDLRTAVTLLRAAHPDLPLTVLGESMGGAVAISALADRYQAPAVDGIVLVAPAVWPRQQLPPMADTLLYLTRNLLPGLELGGQGFGIRPSDNIAMLRALGRDRLIQPYSRVDTLEGLVTLMTEAYDRAEDLPGPAVFLFGDHEQLISTDAIDSLVARLTEERHRVAFYPDGYHMLLRDLNAELVWQDVLAVALDPAATLPSGHAGRPRGGDAAAGAAAAGAPAAE